MKQLQKSDLIDGKIYKSVTIPQIFYIFKATNNLENCYNISYYNMFHNKTGNFNGSKNQYFEAIPEEKHWLETCITAKRFISYDEAMKTFIPEFVLEEPKDKVLQVNQIRGKGTTIIKVECSEGGVYKLGDKIAPFDKNSINKGKPFTITEFRWNNAKKEICAITELHKPNGIRLSQIELYIEPKQLIITESTSDLLKLASKGINAIQINSELSLLEQAKLRYPIGTKFRNAYKGRLDFNKVFIVEEDLEIEHTHKGLGVHIDNEWLFYQDEWAEIVEEADDFVLPEKWVLRFKTRQVFEKLVLPYKSYFVFYQNSGITNTKRNIKLGNYSYVSNDSPLNDHTEITFEQFEKYVLKNEKV